MSQIFSIDQVSINIKNNNTDKPPVLFVHGNSQNSSCGYDLLDYFFQKGHTTVCYDLPGHGNSPLACEYYHFDDLVTLNQQVIKTLDLKRPILSGHSLGGMIQAQSIIQTSIDSPYFPLSLILCGSYDANPIEAAKAQQQFHESEQIDRELTQYIQEAYKLFKQQQFYDFRDSCHLDDVLVSIINRRYTHPLANEINLTTLKSFNARSALSQLTLPILVLHGEKETIIPMSLIKIMQQAYRHLNLELYPDAGHYAFYQQVELTNQLLDKHYQFLLQAQR